MIRMKSEGRSDSLAKLCPSEVGRYLLGLVFVGVGSGVVGAFFTLVLAGVEHLAFGFTTGTFAEAVVRVSAVWAGDSFAFGDL